LAASLLALARERYLLSGLLMGLTVMKPQMTLLEMAFLILWSFSDWRNRKKFSIGLFSMTGILVASALLVWPRWIQSWLLVLWAYRRYANPPLLKELFASPFGPAMASPIGLILMVLALGLSLGLLWHHRSASVDSYEFWLTSALLLSITTITLLPGQAVHDQVILLPGIFLIANTWRSLAANRNGRKILILGAAVGVWPWLAAMGLLALRPMLSNPTFYSKLIFALPLRTAAVFPFLVLVLLVLRYHLWRKQASMSRNKAEVTLS
jgi:Glycosyltransferase family 87